MVTNNNDLYGYYNSDLSHIFQVKKKKMTNQKTKIFKSFHWLIFTLQLDFGPILLS